ncbi:hypothetical protein GEMRC1_014056 [Eukaryota sp. GEM-RC1]
MNPACPRTTPDSTSDSHQLTCSSECNRSSSTPGYLPQPESHTFVPAADLETRTEVLLSKSLEEPMSRLSLILSNELPSSIPSRSVHPIHLQGSLHVSILEHLADHCFDFANELDHDIFCDECDIAETRLEILFSQTLKVFLTNVGFVSHRFYEYALFAFKTFLASKTLRVEQASDFVSWDVLFDLLAVTTFLDTLVGSIELVLDSDLDELHDISNISHFLRAVTALNCTRFDYFKNFNFLTPSNSSFLARLNRLCVKLSSADNNNLWQALQQNNTVKELELDFDSGVLSSEFITFLRDNQSVTILKLRCYRYGDRLHNEPLMVDLCKVLYQSTVLKEIFLEGTVVSNEYLNLLSRRPCFNSVLCPVSGSNKIHLFWCKKDLGEFREVVFPKLYEVKDEDVISVLENNPFLTSVVFSSVFSSNSYIPSITFLSVLMKKRHSLC